ncbi:Gfo/Idh/MocA family protein [Actibacterium lipolyticum]|uniref:Putative oxidoreductase YcjS n=1 Tax=Actibacterium lipolyticum TaxID=1524263 RepID=A0A238JMD3_9RHOB|nr:Gfo/Idh/MocA family oxidoreductase [Actibacterium lipolyticum]SMX31583.1 putative oxidoreductase YcjS [Actibacterium lipolyticum]
MAAKKNVVLIGCGMVASAYVESFRNLSDQMQLAGVLASTGDSGRAFLAQHAKHFPTARAYETLEEVIAAKPDMAVVITPPNARVSIVRPLASAGIPILMEKPIERTFANAQELVEICADIPLGIMLQHRVRPSAKALRELLEARDLGPLGLVEIYVPWWREQAYYDEPGRGTLARDGGGVLISQAIHTLDLALQFTGPVKEVMAMRRTSTFHTMESEDFVSAGLTFENGAAGSLVASTATYPGRTEEIILHYANASVTLKSAELTVNWRTGQTDTIGAAVATGAGGDPMAFTSDWHQAVIADFIDCIDSGATPAASGQSALAVHAVIEAITTSSTTGSVSPIKKVFQT